MTSTGLSQLTTILDHAKDLVMKGHSLNLNTRISSISLVV
jgi:hypothetical protein